MLWGLLLTTAVSNVGQACAGTSPEQFLGQLTHLMQVPLSQPLPVGGPAAGSDVLITSKAQVAPGPSSLDNG